MLYVTYSCRVWNLGNNQSQFLLYGVLHTDFKETGLKYIFSNVLVLLNRVKACADLNVLPSQKHASKNWLCQIAPSVNV